MTEQVPIWGTFDGATIDRDRDHDRLQAQLYAVRRFMNDGAWHTLPEISKETGHPEASVSARLRDLRKAKFGGHTVERRYVEQGLWEYRLTPAIPETEKRAMWGDR